MNTAYRIWIEYIDCTGKGDRYRVTADDGSVLVALSFNPEFAACRALVERGITGRLEVWRKGRTGPDMIIKDIERGAKLTVADNKQGQPRFRPWEPFKRGAYLAQPSAKEPVDA